MSEGIVFVVDDDVAIRRALTRLIRSVGLNVETFGSAKELLEHGPATAPGCIVSDVRMPGLSGMDLQQKLASAGLDLPMIFITGHGTIPMSVHAMKAGAVDFLQKPIDDQVLLDAIHRAIEQDIRNRRELAQRNALEHCLESLTPREREVFALVIQGLLNKQVAAELGTSEKTIKVHRARVMQKMKANSFADLVRMGEHLRILDSSC